MLTKSGLKDMLTQGGKDRPIERTIVGRCRTHVFEFPGALLQAEIDVEPRAGRVRPLTVEQRAGRAKNV